MQETNCLTSIQTVRLWDILCAGHGSQETDFQTRLSHAVCCHSMNIVLVCPMQALSCTQSVSMPDSLSQNQTTCPTQAFSVLKSDSLCHNHLMHILLTCETCVLSLVIQSLPWLLRYSLSQSQTVCLELRQSAPCTSCWSHTNKIVFPLWTWNKQARKKVVICQECSIV